MTKYLIPTDFSKESISYTEKFVEQLSEDKVEILLMFPDYLDDSITDLLFYSPRKFLDSKMPKDYQNWYADFKRGNSDKVNMFLTPFHGFTTNAFLNFAEGNNINYCAIPENLPYKLGTNPNKLISKSKINTI